MTLLDTDKNLQAIKNNSLEEMKSIICPKIPKALIRASDSFKVLVQKVLNDSYKFELNFYQSNCLVVKCVLDDGSKTPITLGRDLGMLEEHLKQEINEYTLNFSITTDDDNITLILTEKSDAVLDDIVIPILKDASGDHFKQSGPTFFSSKNNLENITGSTEEKKVTCYIS